MHGKLNRFNYSYFRFGFFIGIYLEYGIERRKYRML